MNRIFKKLLIGIISLVIALLLYVFVGPLLIRVSNAEVEKSDSWMADIPDDTLISDIFIPGTHDSASEYVQLAFFSQCQAKSIGEQLHDGYRYLDIRLGFNKTGDDLLLYHGFCKCRTGIFPWQRSLEIGDVLERCYVFLEEHPSETIIFAVKNEREGDDESLQAILHKYISISPEKWCLTDTIPTISECRGKLVLFRRYEDACGYGKKAGIQLFWTDQGGNQDSSLSGTLEKQDTYDLMVQDRYKYSSSDKWRAFTDCLNKSSRSDSDLRINFLSTNGTPKYGHPYSYASRLNRVFLDRSLAGYAPAWIIVDFADARLAQHVYEVNFK